MKFQIGDVITGCMKSTQKNIGTGLGRMNFLMLGGVLATIYSLAKTSSMRLFEDTNLNLINICQKKIGNIDIMPPKRPSTQRPIDAIRELIEDQQLQISDLTEVVANQKLEIRELRSKWNARESIEREKKEAEEQKKLESTGWFWAARTSE